MKIKSYTSITIEIITIINIGIANILYVKASINLNSKMHLKALVKPQAGQEILNVDLKKQGIFIPYI